MRGGIEQYGSPLELYERPANVFVAGFIGSPRMNFIGDETAKRHGAATIGVRPEHIKASRDGEGWEGLVTDAEHLGSDTFLHVDVAGIGNLTARSIGEIGLSAGDRARLAPRSRAYPSLRREWKGAPCVKCVATLSAHPREGGDPALWDVLRSELPLSRE